jgi:CAP12/Pycsar effector protein, TIR domain
VELTGQARPNVLLEAGLALAYNPQRTVLVEVGRLRPFSDVAGGLVIRMSNDAATRNALASRLRQAGCAVRTERDDWLTSGDSLGGMVRRILMPRDEPIVPRLSGDLRRPSFPWKTPGFRQDWRRLPRYSRPA